MPMASGNAQTAPKGRATRARNAPARRSLFGPPTQWVVVTVVALVIIGGIFYFGRNVSSTFGGHSGAPAPAVLDAAPSGEL